MMKYLLWMHDTDKSGMKHLCGDSYFNGSDTSDTSDTCFGRGGGDEHPKKCAQCHDGRDHF